MRDETAAEVSAALASQFLLREAADREADALRVKVRLLSEALARQCERADAAERAYENLKACLRPDPFPARKGGR